MATPFLGELKMFGGNFAIRGWAFCNGQTMSIAQNDALYALLGTTYGGDGVNTFGLPNLQGRVPMSYGQGPGLTNRVVAEMSGVETVTLTNNQLPQHNHALLASTAAATTSTPGATVMPSAATGSGKPYVQPGSGTVTPISFAASLLSSGGSQPHDNMMPSLCVSFLIALEGVFPSRN